LAMKNRASKVTPFSAWQSKSGPFGNENQGHLAM